MLGFGRYHSAATARELTKQADRLMTELHVAIRCPFCLASTFFEASDASVEIPAPAERRLLTRGDFIGLLQEHQLDPHR